MKIVFALLATIFISVTGMAQDRWTVQVNSKTLLTANEEDTNKNVVKAGDLKKGSLIVTYHPGKAANERKRRIMIFDLNDQELYSKETYSLVVPVAQLKKWRLTSPQIKVYTMPVLGEEGANVRLRRVHLVTINMD